ncbi:MAG: type III-A CRISPR-associated protein Csm2 [Cuniculiplasma sp.]
MDSSNWKSNRTRDSQRSWDRHEDYSYRDQFQQYLESYVKKGTDDLGSIFSLKGKINDMAVKANIPNSQLRKFFDKFLLIYDEFTSSKSQGEIDKRKKTTIEELYKILYIASYTGNKNNSPGIKYYFIIFFDNIVKELEKSNSMQFDSMLERFYRVLEAWVAYSK